ncbi:HAD family hydrolase [Pararhizobium sp. BT-229]|uniref:HAD family hydrolase n=1 Tax=Pararhizobium sp. BT-229 TaxID=2986923 RepID=UPI0021F750F6|nr:HAD family hydrolase [Pararhizobium sp. BT-229]MCV9963697.1 HAD family hydrolase [Pararhizobium sp. BT-229]
MRHGIKAIIFDAFGTLVTPVPRNGPYHELAVAAIAVGRRFRDEAMTLDLPIKEFAARYGRPDLAERLESELDEEVASVKLFDEVGPYLSLLDWRKVPYAVCSNLAQGYGRRVKELVPGARGYAMSYEIGAYKPQPEIYRAAIDLVGVTPERILFVGDTIRADVEGPCAVGMKAVHLDRSAGDTLVSVIAGALRDAAAPPMLVT